MLFNTFSFWIIFPFIFFFYWIIPSRFNLVKKMFLIFVSYLLYMNYNVAYALVLLYVTIITYKGGLYIEKVSDKRKLFITIGAFLT
ncbi:MAG: MBOAT family protein, partial [Candidatus Phocaeicola faecipullorum]|nr:MBOAT family protein [Candidatus Phocaeicola faecipullorum]